MEHEFEYTLHLQFVHSTCECGQLMVNIVDELNNLS